MFDFMGEKQASDYILTPIRGVPIEGQVRTPHLVENATARCVGDATARNGWMAAKMSVEPDRPGLWSHQHQPNNRRRDCDEGRAGRQEKEG